MTTMQSVDQRPLFVVDAEASTGRIRRVEQLRRSIGGEVLVVGGLEDECRCAELGLRSVGGAPARQLVATVTALRQANRASGPIVCFAIEHALALIDDAPRVVLVTEQKPVAHIDSSVLSRLEVIAPDAQIVRGYMHLGVVHTRVIPPCALPAGAPGARAGDVVCVSLHPGDGVGPPRDEEAMLLMHLVGLARHAGAHLRVLIDRNDPTQGCVVDHAARCGQLDAMSLMRGNEVRAASSVALIGLRGAPMRDELVLDLAAQSIVPVVLSAELDDHAKETGILISAIDQPRASAAFLMEITRDSVALRSAQQRVRAYAAGFTLAQWLRMMQDALAQPVRNPEAASR